MLHYLDVLVNQNVGYTTPKDVIAAIEWLHTIKGWASPSAGDSGAQLIRARRACQTELVKKGAKARRAFVDDEKERLIEDARGMIKVKGDHWDRNMTIIMVACTFGLRISDVVHLQEKHVKWVTHPVLGCKLYLCGEKTDDLNIGKWQSTFLYSKPTDKNDGVIALLEYMRHIMKVDKRTAPNDSFIFKTYQKLSNIEGGTMYKILKEMCLKLNIDPLLVGTHSFRHTCASTMYDEGSTLADIGQRLGHVKNSGSTRFYIDKLRKE